MRTAITAISMAVVVMSAMNQGQASAQGVAGMASHISAAVPSSKVTSAMPDHQPSDMGPGSGPVVLSEDSLASISGGESDQTLVLTNQTLSATSSGNSITANSVNAGDVNFGANVFNGFNGIGNFVINTGNNNAINGSLSVTVSSGALNLTTSP